MKQPFRVGQIVRLYRPGLEFHGELAKVREVVKNILPVKVYGRKRSPKWTFWVLNPEWACLADFWEHELRATTKKERQYFHQHVKACNAE